MITVEVHGTDELRRAARDLRAGHEVLRREVMDALLEIPDILRPAVQVQAALTLPAGYAPIYAASLRVAALPSPAGWAAVRVRGSGRSRNKGRDLQAIEYRGALRHPVFGQARNAWATTQVAPGLWSRAAAAREGAVVDRVERAVDRAADQIERG